jgi:hypothetical protein
VSLPSIRAFEGRLPRRTMRYLTRPPFRKGNKGMDSRLHGNDKVGLDTGSGSGMTRRSGNTGQAFRAFRRMSLSWVRNDIKVERIFRLSFAGVS